MLGSQCPSPFPLAVLKLLDSVAKHVLQRTAERQSIFLVYVERQRTCQQPCRDKGKEKVTQNAEDCCLLNQSGIKLNNLTVQKNK